MLRALVLLASLACTGSASAQCRQALALGLDVSGSVDSSEYRMQLDGLAAALQNEQVRAALMATPHAPVHLAVYEWSGAAYQRILVDWTAIVGDDDLARVVRRLATTRNVDAPPGTALGAAMRFGAGLLARQDDCLRRTLDISGDGKHNLGPHPRDVRAALSGTDLTINALVIGSDTTTQGGSRQTEIAELSSYFHAWVTSGPGPLWKRPWGSRTTRLR